MQDFQRDGGPEGFVGTGNLVHHDAARDHHTVPAFQSAVQGHHEVHVAARRQEGEAGSIGRFVEQALQHIGAAADLHVARHRQVQPRRARRGQPELKDLAGGGRLQRCGGLQGQRHLSRPLEEQQGAAIVTPAEGGGLAVLLQALQADSRHGERQRVEAFLENRCV